MTYALKRYRYMMYITNSDWHAVERDGRWEIHNNDLLVDYADNSAIAEAKLLDRFEAEYGVVIS